MDAFTTMTSDELATVDGGSVLLTANYILVKVAAKALIKAMPSIIKAGIGIAGSITAQKTLDKIFD